MEERSVPQQNYIYFKCLHQSKVHGKADTENGAKRERKA